MDDRVITGSAALLERACRADVRIRALDQVVTALATAAQLGDDPACSCCVWTQLVKPLVRPLVGWKRGYPLPPAKDPDADPTSSFGPARRRPPVTDTERWLRSEEAWYAVTGAWIARLRDADPNAGHGIGYLAGGR